MEAPRSRTSILLPYQQKWIADPAPVRVFEKSRQIGITWTMEAESVLTAARATRPSDVWYTAQDKDQAVEFIRECNDWVDLFSAAAVQCDEEMIEDEDDDILTFYIRFASGKRINALASRPRKLRGKKGLIVVDEAAYHDDLRKMLKAAMATLIWGNRVAIISSHNGVDNQFNEILRDVRTGKLNYSLHRCTFDEAIEAGLYKRICVMLGKEWSPQGEVVWRQEIVDLYGEDADEELFCIPSSETRSYISRATIERAMDVALVARLKLERNFLQRPDKYKEEQIKVWFEANVLPALKRLSNLRDNFVGMDVGRHIDLSSIAVGERDSALTHRIPLVIEMRNVPFDQQKQVLRMTIENLPRLTKGGVDRTGSGMDMAEYAEQQWPGQMEGIDITRKWYAESMPSVRAALEAQTLVPPRDEFISEDLQAIELIDGVPKLPKKKTNKKGAPRHGDSAISITLAHNASRAPGFSTDYESADESFWEAKQGVI